jgi:hypothetical protein
MSQIVKVIDGKVTEDLLVGLIGKIVSVPTNEHYTTKELTGERETVNVFFAGEVAGVDKTIMAYDYLTNTYLKEPIVAFSLILTDGAGYILSATKSEILEITLEEFEELVIKHQKEVALKNSIILPNRDIR